MKEEGTDAAEEGTTASVRASTQGMRGPLAWPRRSGGLSPRAGTLVRRAYREAPPREDRASDGLPGIVPPVRAGPEVHRVQGRAVQRHEPVRAAVRVPLPELQDDRTRAGGRDWSQARVVRRRKARGGLKARRTACPRCPRAAPRRGPRESRGGASASSSR